MLERELDHQMRTNANLIDSNLPQNKSSTTDANPNIARKLNENVLLSPGINRICRMNEYTMMVTNDQVSLGSHPQYLPQDSLAQIPPRKLANYQKYQSNCK